MARPDALRLNSCSPTTLIAIQFVHPIVIDGVAPAGLGVCDPNIEIRSITLPREDVDDLLDNLLGIHVRSVPDFVPREVGAWIYVPWSNILAIRTNPPTPEQVNEIVNRKLPHHG